LDGARLAERVGQMNLLAIEGHALAVEESAQHDRGLLELIEAILDRQERHPEGAELVLVPARAEPELGAAPAQVVDRDGGFAEHARVSVADAKDQTADAYARRGAASAAIVAIPSNAGLAGLARSEIE
jgi:hypothetical protein